MATGSVAKKLCRSFKSEKNLHFQKKNNFNRIFLLMTMQFALMDLTQQVQGLGMKYFDVIHAKTTLLMFTID